MTDDQKLHEQFRRWETIIRRPDLRAKWRSLEGGRVYEIVARTGRQPTPAERLNGNDFREYWLQRYITENHRRLGFVELAGPHSVGPDFQIKTKAGGPWHEAEAEIEWKSYIKHKHHVNIRFKDVRYLILLSTGDAPANLRDKLPPNVLHVDRAHFLAWYKPVGLEYARSKQPVSKLNARVNLIAGEMQSHWITICADTARDMATCPDCDSCAYFRDGTFNEARPFF